MNEIKPIQALIKQVLQKKKLTQKALAQQLEVTPTAVSQWMHGKEKPGLQNLTTLIEMSGIGEPFFDEEYYGVSGVAYVTALTFKTEKNFLAWREYVTRHENAFWRELKYKTESFCNRDFKSFWEGLTGAFFELSGEPLPENPELIPLELGEILRKVLRHLFAMLVWFEEVFGPESSYMDDWEGLPESIKYGLLYWRYDLAFKLSLGAASSIEWKTAYPRDEMFTPELTYELIAEGNSDRIFDELCEHIIKVEGWTISTDYYAISRVETDALIKSIRSAQEEDERLSEQGGMYTVPTIEIPMDPTCSIYTKYDSCSRIYMVNQIAQLNDRMDHIFQLLKKAQLK